MLKLVTSASRIMRRGRARAAIKATHSGMGNARSITFCVKRALEMGRA